MSQRLADGKGASPWKQPLCQAAFSSGQKYCQKEFAHKADKYNCGLMLHSALRYFTDANRRISGGAMQLSFSQLTVDYYPYHKAGKNKS